MNVLVTGTSGYLGGRMVNPWIASSQKLIEETGSEFIYSTRDAFENFGRSVTASDH